MVTNKRNPVAPGSAGGIFLLSLLLLSCSANRQKVALTPEPRVESEIPSQVVLAQEPDHLLRDRQRAAEILVRDTQLLFARGKELFEQENPELGRLYFQEAQDLVNLSGFSFEDYPIVEHAYFDLLGKIRSLEVRALFEPERLPFPEEELADSLSPLDEIAGLDLMAMEVDPALEHLVSEDVRQTPFDFPVQVNKQVVRFLDYYQGRGRKATEEALRRSGRYLRLFKRTFAEEGLPQDLVYMAHVESLFKPKAYSRARARGLWQFVAGTARLYGLKVGWWLDERLDIVKATQSAARHLKDLKQEFGDWYLVLAAYNGGPGRVKRVLRRYGNMDYWTMATRRLLPRETRNFVPSILASMIIYRNPEKYGFSVQPEPPLEFETVAVDYQVDLRVIAEETGVDYAHLERLNPELQKGVTPFETAGYRLKVPIGKGDIVTKKLAQIPPDKRLRLRHHRVQKGETLSLIASRYGVSIRAIAEMNRIRNIHRLRLGQNLIIPLTEGRGTLAGRGVGASGEHSDSHIVRRGDSLYKIARYYGVKMGDLFRWNKLGPGDLIHPGQEIRLSGEE